MVCVAADEVDGCVVENGLVGEIDMLAELEMKLQGKSSSSRNMFDRMLFQSSE